MMMPYPSSRFIQCLLWTVVMASTGISADNRADTVTYNDDPELFVTGTRVVKVYPDTRTPGTKQYDDHITVKLHLAAKVWTLLGSPVYMCSGWWELESVVMNYDRQRLGDIPQSVKHKINIWDSTFRFNIAATGGASFGNGVKLVCDAGIFEPPGVREASFNVPGSVGWDRIFEYSDADVFTHGPREKQAKKVMKNARRTDYTVIAIDVIQLKASLGPVYDWIHAQEGSSIAQEEEAVEQELQKVPDDFDGLFDTVDNAKLAKTKTQKLAKTKTTFQHSNQAMERQRAARLSELRRKDCGKTPPNDTSRRDLKRYIDAQSQRMAECLTSTVLIAKQHPATGLWGYSDKQGEWRIPAKFKAAKPFSGGLAAVSNAMGEWGYLTPLGQWHIRPQYRYADDFHPQRHQAVIATEQGSGVIDLQGDIVIKPEWAGVSLNGANYLVQTPNTFRVTRTEREERTHCGKSYWKTIKFSRTYWKSGEISQDGAWVSPLRDHVSDESKVPEGITLSRSCN